MTLPFVKMNGLGNDFVIVVAGVEPFEPAPAQVRAIADRTQGVGCDQLIAMTWSASAHVGMRIWNADGGEVGACGNAARCVGWLAMEALSLDHARIATSTGWLEADRAGERRVTVDMGPPRLGWRDIPLAREMDTVKLDIAAGPDLVGPGCVSMGNPHVVFFVPDLDFAPVTRAGPLMEHHPLFPQRANVGFVQVIEPGRLRARVWERGAGLTQACGTGACAAVVAGHRQGLCDRACVVQLDGGDLDIRWSPEDDHVRMTGPVTLEFTGRLPPLESLS